MRYLILTIALLTGCATIKPLCRHEVLSQYAACMEQGYETEIWHMRNTAPSTHKYHVAVRIKKDGRWQWLEQGRTPYRITRYRPNNTELIREMEFEEVVKWIKEGKK